MKIKEIKVLVCCPGRNFVTVKITTDTGIYGLGDATLNGREMAVASCLIGHIAPTLIGKEAEIPPEATIGRNCIINPLCKQEEFSAQDLDNGETL